MEARNVKERSGGKRGFECGGHAHFPAPRICMGEDQWLSGGDVRGWERGGGLNHVQLRHGGGGIISGECALPWRRMSQRRGKSTRMPWQESLRRLTMVDDC